MIVTRERLALDGGPPVLEPGDITPWCAVSDLDRTAVNRVLDSGVLAGSTAPETTRFQDEWSSHLGVRHTLLTNSGTAALHMALAAVGVRPGDEVIVPAYTFVASAMAVLHQNAIPVFADVDPLTHGIDPDAMAAAITSRTVAVVVVHLNGQPAAMDPIIAIARRAGLAIVEDACQAHGASFAGRKVGTLGDAGAFSLNKSKSLPAGEGGIFVSDDDGAVDAARRLMKFGEIYHADDTRDYHAYGLGWMYRSTELTAALAGSRLTRLDAWSEERRANRRALDALLGDVPGVRVSTPIERTRSVPWRYTFQVAPEDLGLAVGVRSVRKAVRQALAAEGVPVGEWQRMVVPEQTLFQRRVGHGGGCPWTCARSVVQYVGSHHPVATDVIDRSIWLTEGIQPGNSAGTIDKLAVAIQKVMGRVPDLVSRERR